MPPDNRSSTDAFGVDPLDQLALNTQEGVDSAIGTIETTCRLQGDPGVARVVTVLHSRPRLLEYVVSVMDEKAHEKIVKWIVAGFPTSITPNVMDATSVHILRRLSCSLLSVEYPSAADVPPGLRAFRKKVDLSFDVLRTLEENVDSLPTQEDIPPVSGKVFTNNPNIDLLPFRSMGIAEPTSAAEVRDVHAQVLSHLKNALEYYLLILRTPIYSEIFRISSTETTSSSEGVQMRDPVLPPTRPPNASLYFDGIKDFGEWLILLSGRAQKDLQGFERDDGAMFQIAMNKIEQLSKGQFSQANRKLLTAPKMGVPVYRARMTGDKRIIYRIDGISDPRNLYDSSSPYECQAIWVFGIFSLAELKRTRFWDTLSRQFQERGPDYVERCTLQRGPQLGTDDDVISPALFPPQPELDPDAEGSSPLVSEEEIKEIHSMLVMDKFVVMSKAVLNSILNGKEIVHVPPLSTREREIIEHPTSCYVIGRSGTGKTTTMLMKMLGIQHTEAEPKPRQIFVTQSPVLAKKVKEYFLKLTSSIEVATHSNEGVHTTENDNEQETELSEEEGGGLISHQYSKRWRSDLPERFSGLRDGHFPLFVTYDQLSTMLENDIGLGDHGSKISTRQGATPSMSPTSSWNPIRLAGSRITSSSDYMQQSRTNFVSYGVFLASYWDHLPQTITRKLDPALVFGEFMGVIKGSEDTVGIKGRCLDRETYKLLSPRSQATFSDKRDDIYDLFIAYDKLRGQRQDYDAADRTHAILRALHGGRQIGQKVDFLYVDEVQDHLLIDTLVLRTICANKNGLFWAGDTAQTISVGSSFRFADLKAYQYRIEKRLPDELGITPVEPRTFELTINHRSHSGIVNCARSIVKLILRYWPHSIDALKPEQATAPGFRPIFLEEDVDLDRIFSTNSQGESIDLGAKLCVLVRNEVTKARLEEKYPTLGENFIMTLHESKGLEFDHVILYNFFGDSMASPNQWRLVLNGIFYEDRFQDAPTFDGPRHASICVELKFLYVAITRARQNLLIMDNSSAAVPMKMYWSSKGQISIWSSTTEVPNLATESTPEEWLKAGDMMFENERYAQAAVAFRRAGQDKKAKMCDAYLLQEKAGLISTTASSARKQAFLTAAKAFLACVHNSQRVEERLTCHHAAGDCYFNARDLKSAGDNYRLAELYPEAACTFQEGRCFDEMVKVITQHKSAFTDDLHKKLTMDARMYYFKSLNIKAALRLFPSEDHALEFLEDWDLDEPRIKLLLDRGMILEAAAVRAKNGELLKAVEILNASVVRGVDIVRRMIEYLFLGLRPSFTLGIIPPSTRPTISELLAIADRLDKAALTEQESNELAMFHAIQRPDHGALRALAKIFLRTKNDPAALLCLDHAFSSPLKLQNLPLSEVQASLTLYLDYVRLLNKFRRDESFVNDSNHQRLFGFRVLRENRWVVPKHAILHGKLASMCGSTRQSVDGCGFDELRRGITAILESRIRVRTVAQNKACCRVLGLSPCLRLLVQGECNLPSGQGGCALQHIKPRRLSVDWYHTRLCLILLQFQILGSARLYDFQTARYWLGKLYSMLHPPFQTLGSIAKRAIATVPETSAGLGVVRNWVQRACRQLNYPSPEHVDHFRQFFVVLCTLAFDLGRNVARKFVPHTPMYRSKLWPGSPFRGAENLIVQDFVAFLNANRFDSLTLGTSYLQGVLRAQLLVDLNVLCDLVERLTGLFIMAHNVDPQSRVLHEVALPRSWFINIILPGANMRKDPSLIFNFASTVVEFMHQIDAQVQRYPTATTTSNERFIAGAGRVDNFKGPLYIARICLCLCIMGYNMGDDVRERILADIQSLHKGERELTPLVYQRYTDAKNWNDLVHAFTESLKHPFRDEMILLLHKTLPGPCGRWSEHVFPITYDTLGGVPKLLLAKVPSTIRADVTHNQPKQRPEETETEAQLKRNHGEKQQPDPVDASWKKVVKSKGVEMNRLDSHKEQDCEEIRINAAKMIQDAYRAHRRHLKQKRVSAARKIQVAYRRHLKRKNVVRKGIDELRVHYWRVLRMRSREMEWSKDSRYFILFRVPLADILVCLDIVGTFFQSEKKEANKRMVDPQNNNHEELNKAVDQYRTLLKQTSELQKKLSPSSEFHEKQSVTDLQQAVRKVKTIVENLDILPGSIGTRNKIKKRWDRGWKWISEKQESRAKGKK